jgi:hypothetical protein
MALSEEGHLALRSDPRITLFVVDPSPLITLAAANSLDYLLYVEGADLVIPHAVLYEATHDASRLGAADILAWVKANRRRIEVAPTNTYLIVVTARSVNPNLREADLGEKAAVEVIEEPGRLEGSERGVLLCEETSVLKRATVRDKERIVELSTMDFLGILEAEQRIQSAAAVFEMAIAAGRTPSTVEKLAKHEAMVQETIHQLLRRPGD